MRTSALKKSCEICRGQHPVIKIVSSAKTTDASCTLAMGIDELLYGIVHNPVNAY